MVGKYTFPNTHRGCTRRGEFAAGLTLAGYTCVLSEEKLVVGELTFTLLKLTVTGKREGEGQIAANVKKLKAGKRV